jgi:hypothetical protein
MTELKNLVHTRFYIDLISSYNNYQLELDFNP